MSIKQSSYIYCKNRSPDLAKENACTNSDGQFAESKAVVYREKYYFYTCLNRSKARACSLNIGVYYGYV